MKHILFGILTAFVLALQLTPLAQAAGVNDFTIETYDINYDLTRDESGHSKLRTVETITARFPSYDQNHGIERALPSEYQGHGTNLTIESIKKPDGSAWNYSTRESNGNTIIRIGDADTYVRGQQTFVITYTQQDVTDYFSSTNSDEFYWDTNGTEWRVPVEKLTLTLAIGEDLAEKLNGKTACYLGTSGQDEKCSLTQASNIFSASTSDLKPGENVTIAVGFAPKTFSEYQPSLWERLFSAWIILTAVIAPIAVGIMTWLLIRWANWNGRRKDIGTIVPEYLPPRDVSLSTMATIIKPHGAVFTAQLIDFAVRHYIKIYETSKKSLFKAADYTVEVIKDVASLSPEEQEVLSDIFGGKPTVGQQLALSKLRNNSAVYTRMSDNDKKLTELVRGKYALREKNPTQSAWFRKVGYVLIAVGVVTLNPVVIVVALVSFICGYTLWPLSEKGVALRRYGEGMKTYIHVAEAERLQLLQSPDGAAKLDGVDVGQPGQLVKLYERMLPYAILFGHEKEWSKRIGELYESTKSAPDWYSGNSAFNAVVFASAVSSFSTTATYSAPSSSTSGGSGGGGFSGGGGGGGGGGGW